VSELPGQVHQLSEMTAGEPRVAPVQPMGSPVDETQRIASIDVLRGVALLGILIMNIQTFAMIGSAYMNPNSYGDLSGANWWVWRLTHLLGDQKFMTIFSMLFGAGIVLMTSRAEQRSGKSAGLHYRRMGWLILFGLLHAHLLWYGDILYSYGMCGLIAYLFRKLPPRWLIVIGVVVMSVSCLINFGMYSLYSVLPEEARQGWDQGMAESWTPSAQTIQEELDAYRGGWLSQAPHRSIMAAVFQTFLFGVWAGWRAGGLMLIGMALFKLDVFAARRSTRFYTLMAVVGICSGLALTHSEMRLVEASGWPMMESMYLYSALHYWGSFLQSLGYVGVVMLACKFDAFRSLQHALAAVGRMALTNYLLQTIICTTIFYGHGFGLFGSVERIGQIGIVACVWAIQLIVSPIWLHYFRFGPMEWLWRTLTYWRLQPMRRGTSLPSPSLA
jgi:uncharacterized protein